MSLTVLVVATAVSLIDGFGRAVRKSSGIELKRHFGNDLL